ncbi:MAG TPA: HD domain-containing phosphohydrolase [Candidatus Eisenbacteria bacterium]|jgi:signal transduction histidine kinase/HD-GYP domain-containing protein (c-di-GMP phosphodiesterase class II)
MTGTRDPALRGTATPYRPLPSLSSLSLAVQSAIDRPSLITAVAQHALELARADTFSLLLLDYETGELEGDSFERGVVGAVGHGRVVPAPGGFLAQILRRETIAVDDPAGMAPADREPLRWPGGPPESLIGVPILVGTTLLGVALLGYRRRIHLASRRRRVLHLLADQIGLALDRIRTRAELEVKSVALEEARAGLRRADESKTDLISVVSHELRTPLTAIKAYTETLLDNLDNPEFPVREKFLTIIDEECDRLTRMVNDVLDLSRMDSGKRRLRPEAFELRRLVEELLPTVEPALHAKRLRFSYSEEPNLPSVEADPDLLRQVLVNLIHNAAKFTREGTTVWVRAARRGERLELMVVDEGEGISPENLPRVFERFYRVESSGASQAPGTGLGLAIVKSAVELHGGTIRVESEPDRGARFVIDLPLVQRGFRTLVRALEEFLERPELRQLLQSCAEMIAEVMEARIVSLMFYTEDALELVIRAAVGLDADVVARSRVKSGSSIAGWVAQTAENLLVNDIESDRRFRRLNNPQYETKSLLCVPLRVEGETVGVVNVSSRAAGPAFDRDDLNLLVAISKRVGAAIERARAAGASGSGDLETTLQTIRTVIRARRMGALRSSRRGFKLATELGRRLGLSDEDVEVLGYVARVHDVGMLEVGRDLLESARRLSAEDRDAVNRHPQEGIRLLKPIEFASKVNEIILAHHEHWDGRGYPRGLAGQAIPLAARVLAVVDAFESMTVGRPYRDALPEPEARVELMRCAGTQFDPRVCEAFEALLAESPPERTERGRGSTTPMAPRELSR